MIFLTIFLRLIMSVMSTFSVLGKRIKIKNELKFDVRVMFIWEKIVKNIFFDVISNFADVLEESKFFVSEKKIVTVKDYIFCP